MADGIATTEFDDRMDAGAAHDPVEEIAKLSRGAGQVKFLYGPNGKPMSRVPVVGDGDLLRPYGQDAIAVQYRGYLFFPNQDTLIDRQRMDIYTTMLNDVEVENAVNSNKNAVIASRGEVIPASNDSLDLEIAEFVRWNFSEMEGSVEDFLFQILDSIAYGYCPAEKMFYVCDSGEYKDKYCIGSIQCKYPGDYEFRTNDYAQVIALLCKTQEMPQGEVVPREKFVVHTFNPRFGWPHGKSALRKAYKHWWSKDFLLKWWNIYLETFGMPTRIAKFPKGQYQVGTEASSDAGQKRLQAILESIMNNTCITLPDDIVLDFKEVSLGGAVGFQKAIEYHDKQIKTGIQGEILTSGTGGAGGSSYALGDVHGETKEDYVERIRRSICDSVMYEQVIKHLVRINYPGVTRYPRYSLTSRTDSFSKFTTDDMSKLFTIGLITKSDFNFFRDKMGLPPMSEEDMAEDIAAGDAEESQDTTDKQGAESGPGGSSGGNDKKETGEEEESELSKYAKDNGFSRELNEYEKRTDFKKMVSDMDSVNDELIGELSAIVLSMKNKMLAYLPRVFKEDKIETRDILELKLIGLPEFSKAIKTAYLDALQKQIEVAYSEIDGGALEHGKHDAEFEEAEQFAKMQMADRVNPSKEVALIQKWKAEGNWKAIRAWRARKAAELAGSAEANAIWVTDVVKTSILQQVKSVLMSGIQNGADVNSMMKGVGDVFEKYIQRGEISNTELASASRLEAIVRTNTTRVFAAARVQAFREGSSDNYPAMAFSAIIDDRTSDICEELDGQVYLNEDPIWNTITPPLHYNCRSTVVPVYYKDLPEEMSKQPDISKIKTEFGGTG